MINLSIKKVAGVALVVTTLISQAAGAGTLVLAGSTTIQKRVLEPASAAIEQATGTKLEIKGIGSGGGFKELLAGKVKASIAYSPLSSLLKKNGLADDGTYQEHVIIEDIIVPIVHTSNSVSELSWE